MTLQFPSKVSRARVPLPALMQKTPLKYGVFLYKGVIHYMQRTMHCPHCGIFAVIDFPPNAGPVTNTHHMNFLLRYQVCPSCQNIIVFLETAKIGEAGSEKSEILLYPQYSNRRVEPEVPG